MGKKEKKSKSAEQKARNAARQEKKSSKREKKTLTKSADDSDAEDVDLESVLEEYARQQAQFLKVTELPCDPPSPRVSATLLGSPSNAKELFLFGGEFYDGSLASFFNDLLVYHIERNEWKRVTSPNSPLPRSGHAWCRGGNAGGIYLFGGEFSSPKQGTFYHYNDFWRLDPATREWTRIETKGKNPSARSGHRMTYYKNYIVLFGGFQDTSSQTKYLQDLWIYDCQRYVWHNPVPSLASQKPDSRSSFSLHPHEHGAVLYGGYSRVKRNVTAGKLGRAGTSTNKTAMKPVIHEDSWFLRISDPGSEAAISGPQIRWERRKKPANSPNPARAGVTQVFHKGRGIMFGGVHDVEETEEGIDSEFFDQLFAWNIERNRFFPLNLKRQRVPVKRPTEDRGRRDRGKADEAELLRNLAALEQKESLDDIEATESLVTEEDPRSRQTKVIMNTMPHKRFNASLAIQNDTLFMYGGTYERGDNEFAFDEMYAIDLGKLDGVEEIFRRELEQWAEKDVESESESDEGDEDSDEMEDVLQEDSPTNLQGDGWGLAVETESSHVTENANGNEENEGEEKETATRPIDDGRPHPRPYESLRDFFSRTTTEWQEVILRGITETGGHGDASIKEMRRAAFEAAEAEWWDSREDIAAEEERLEEAGVGEVINLADRSRDNGQLGKRR